MDTAVVILNFNGKHWLEKFLPNVIENTPDARIIVADNASTDDSIAFMLQQFPEIELIQLKENTGYAGGYNEALKQVDAQYYMLLNSDIEVTPNWLKPLVNCLEEHPDIAAIQPKILNHGQKSHFEHAGASGGFIDYLGYPFCRGRVFSELEEDKAQYQNPSYCFWATGACLLVRAQDFWKAGALDADFFAHMEEIDLCWRLQLLGKSSAVLPSSIVYHVGGGTLNQLSPTKTYLNFRNNLFMLFKNLPRHKLLPVIFFRMLLDGVAGIKFILGLQIRHFFAILKAHTHFYLALRKLRKKRKLVANKRSLSTMNGVLKKSLVLHYFVKGVKTFNKLAYGLDRPFKKASKANS